MGDMDIEDDIKEAIHFLPEAVHAYISCPNCGSFDFEIVGGRGVYIRRIEAVG
jgi:hydrogenase nickel incorporation protein HypA/HybF